jgi:hypothetical protein
MVHAYIRYINVTNLLSGSVTKDISETIVLSDLLSLRMVAASEVELTEGPRSLSLLPRKMRHSTSSVYLPHSPHTLSSLYNVNNAS